VGGGGLDGAQAVGRDASTEVGETLVEDFDLERSDAPVSSGGFCGPTLLLLRLWLWADAGVRERLACRISTSVLGKPAHSLCWGYSVGPS
jgi:hypothetical protein